jgi:hypothetical protein
VSVDQVRAIVERGDMPDGLSLTSVCYALATGAI